MKTHAKQGIEQYLQQVVSILGRGNDHFQQVIAIIQQERDAITGMDTSTLIRLTNAKEEAFAALQGLDDELRDILAHLEDGDRRSAVKLSMLDPYFPGQMQKRFRALRKEWTARREEVLAGNVVNRKFIQETLSFLGDAIALFAGGDRRQNEGYKAAGTPNRVPVAPCVISREV